MSLRKLSRGDKVEIAAKDYNRWQDAGLASALSRLNQSAGLVLPDAQEGIILIQNTLTRALPRYAVLGVRGTVYNPLSSSQQSTEFQNQIALKGELPTSTTSGRFCVLQTDAAPGEVVPAMVSGVTPCKLSVTATSDEFADIETNTALDQTRWLKTGSSGSAQILYQPEVTGEQWGVVRISNRPVSVDIVQVYHSSSGQYDVVSANGDGLHSGRIKRVVDGTMTTFDNIWILFVDEFDTLTGNVVAINQDYYGPARYSGTFTSGADQRPLYVVRRGGIGTDVVRFELTATLALSGNAEAKLMQPDGSGAWEVTDPVVEIQVYDPFGGEGMWNGVSGYQGYAIPRGQSYLDTVPDPDETRPAYDIVWMERIAQEIQFTTTEYMGASTAGRVAVTVNWYDGQGTDPGSVIARDPQGQFPDVHSGAKGTAVYDNHNGYYRIVSCQRVAIFAEALLTADSCGSSMSIDNFTIRPCGDHVGAPPTTPTAPSNLHDFAGLDNDKVSLRRINNTMPEPTWDVIAIDVHAKTVMVDVQVTGLTLQKKEITIYTQVCTTVAPSWATWHTGDDCDP